MIFLLFFLPVAIYLLYLSRLNRGRQARVISGTWDLMGILLALSGFLLFAGPAILSGMNERWRQYWLFGRHSGPQPGETISQLSLILSLLYFGLIVGGVSYLFWRQRGVTSIYNVEPPKVERTLQQVFDQLNLNPIHSGSFRFFGMDPGDPVSALSGKESSRQKVSVGEKSQTAVLELESWAAMRHVTLRWDPPCPEVREKIETNLQKALAHQEMDEGELGTWIFLVAMVLLCLIFWGGLGLVIYKNLYF